MANSLLTIDMITREAQRILHNSLPFVSGINRAYDKSFAKEGAKIGDSLRIRLPNQYTVTDGATLSAQDTTEQQVTLPVTSQKHVGMNFTSADLTLSLDDFSKRIIEPAIKRLASEVDRTVLEIAAKGIYNSVGDVGTDPATARVYLDAGAKISDYAGPTDMRGVYINPAAQAGTVDGLKGLFQSAGKISNQYVSGRMADNVLGFDFNMTQNIYRHTAGSFAGTPAVNGASQTGATLAMDGFNASATGVYKAGDVFTLPGVYGVNPETKQTLSTLQQFVVTADVDADGSGEADVPISPSIVTSGALQTVSGSPADDAEPTEQGTAGSIFAKNIACHKDAITFATADLVLPRGVDMASRVVQDNISLRIVRDYDINNDKMPCRVDVLFGAVVMRPELGCTIVGA